MRSRHAGIGEPAIGAGLDRYVRFHGTEGKYRGHYSEATLRGWADWMREQADAERTVWAYFNNDYDAKAIGDAQRLKAMVG